VEGLEVRDGFWAGRKVLVTGHSGFKGGWLSLWLSELGARVTGYALAPPTSPSLFAAAGVEAGMASIEGDVRDRGALSACFADAAPEIVFHLAAQPLVRASYADPVETFETNVLGTLNVLEAARQAPGVRVVVNVTSDKCYENREWRWGYR
jgi:CDP-glucose 4,6-dehydratase